MTEYELMDAFATQMVAVDRVFEFWLTASFAVIVAAHFAGRDLSKSMRLMIALLYIGTSAFFAYRYSMATSMTYSLGNELGQKGMYRVPNAITQLTPYFGILRALIFITGVAGTVYFLMSNKTRAVSS
jgi:hypothetical protein